mgnify:CR=1 FL=1
MKINKILIFFVFFLTLSCASLKEAGKVLRNEKLETTDEFLVKQKEPLELPPDFNNLPRPNSQKKEQLSEDQKIKEILKVPSSNTNKAINNSSTIEESIMEKIKK